MVINLILTELLLPIVKLMAVDEGEQSLADVIARAQCHIPFFTVPQFDPEADRFDLFPLAARHGAEDGPE